MRRSPYKLVLHVDEAASMEKLTIDKHVINEGNEWDYHLADAAEAIKDVLDHLGISYTYEQKRYKYKR